MNRQERADEIIEHMAKVLGSWNSIDIHQLSHALIKRYQAEYLEPKDPLEDQIGEFVSYSHQHQFKENISKFREIFADDLNGTRGLDEAINWIYENPEDRSARVVRRLQQIKEGLEK